MNKKELERMRKRLASLKHGKSHTSIHGIWGQMKQRCLNVNDKQYQHYGGRGIGVCDRWLKFENFYEDMGERPNGLTLERIDNDGDYCPENCRWATYLEQQKNRSNSLFVSINGVKVSFTELAMTFNIHRSTLYGRIFVKKLGLREALIKNK